MSPFSRIRFAKSATLIVQSRWTRPTAALVALLLIGAVAAHAQAGGSPFDTGFTAIQTLFTGTIAKVASLVAIVIGGYGFAHGEPGAKNSRFAYVSVSRASLDASIYTNNAASLGTDLSREVGKSAAMDVSQSIGHAGADLSQGIGF